MKISIVTISYNQGDFLGEAIQSVVGQNYSATEYIIVDAGSTDKSREIITQYGTKISKTVFEKDNGPADGLNKGLALCTGDIFCYINADDRFLPGAFDYVASYFRNNPSVDGIIGSAFVIDAQGNRERRRRLSTSYTIDNVINESAIAIQQATFLRLSTMRKHNIMFNEKNTTSWDAELLIDLLLKKAKFVTITKTLGEFRIYPESITGSQRFAEKLVKDRESVRRKISGAGFDLNKNRWFKRFLFRLGIVRRFNEIFY